MPRLKQVIPFLVLVATALACAVPGISAPDADAISTSAAETIIAGLTQNPGESLTPTTAPTLTLTFTPTLIYLTSRFPSETATLSPAPGTITPTPEVTATFTLAPVEISVSRPTHCRSGPGKAYEIVGSFLVGMTAPVLGRDPTSQYWYIPNPYVFTEYCWVWGEYASFTGNPLLVPMVTPPATPTSTGTPVPVLDFKLHARGMQSCNGSFWMNLEIASESIIPFNSISIVMRDETKAISRSSASNTFLAGIGCNPQGGVESVSPGQIVTVSGPRFDYNLRGNAFTASVTVCSEEDQKGACTTREIKLNP